MFYQRRAYIGEDLTLQTKKEQHNYILTSHFIVTAVERNKQLSRIINFLRRLFARFKQNFHKHVMNKNI